MNLCEKRYDDFVVVIVWLLRRAREDLGLRWDKLDLLGSHCFIAEITLYYDVLVIYYMLFQFLFFFVQM